VTKMKSLIDILNEFTLSHDSFGPLHEMGWRTLEYVKIENAYVALQESAEKYRVVDSIGGGVRIKLFGHNLNDATDYFKVLATGHTRDIESGGSYREQVTTNRVSITEGPFGEHKPLLHFDTPGDNSNPTLTKRKPVVEPAPETREQIKARIEEFYTSDIGWIDMGQSSKNRNNWVRLRKRMGNFNETGGYRYDVVSMLDGVFNQKRFATRLSDAKRYFEELVDHNFLPDPIWPEESAITTRFSEATDPSDALIEGAPDMPPPTLISMATHDWTLPSMAKVSWYGDDFQGKPVAWSRAPEEFKLFNKNKYTAANWDRKMLGRRVKVVYGNRAVVVLITDRGPHPRLKRDFDLSEIAATHLGFKDSGLARVRAQIVPDSTPLGPTPV
jgi:hypothetical protein